MVTTVVMLCNSESLGHVYKTYLKVPEKLSIPVRKGFCADVIHGDLTVLF